MDFAAVIKKGLLKGWNDQQILDRFSERIKTYSNSLEQQEIFLDFRKTDQFRELSEAALQVSEFIFHLLRYTMLSYKLKHMHTAILGYNLYEELVTLTAVGVGGTPLRTLMTIPFHEFLPLIIK